MANRREVERKSTTYYFKVYDKDTGQLIGHTMDITTEGIMLTSLNPNPTNLSFELTIDFPFSIEEFAEDTHEIEFRARSLWCTRDQNTALYDTGFHIEKVQAESKKKIDALIKDYTFKGPRELRESGPDV